MFVQRRLNLLVEKLWMKDNGPTQTYNMAVTACNTYKTALGPSADDRTGTWGLCDYGWKTNKPLRGRLKIGSICLTLSASGIAKLMVTYSRVFGRCCTKIEVVIRSQGLLTIISVFLRKKLVCGVWCFNFCLGRQLGSPRLQVAWR